VLGIQDAEHEESSPDAPTLVVSRLVCSLVGSTGVIRISPHTLAHKTYGRDEATEQFRCSYGLNPSYLPRFANSALKVTGTDDAGEARIVELTGHPFFVATLFLPQLLSQPKIPHPLVVAYLTAAGAFSTRGTRAA
jgi:CTP synthase (UTP-ammonia lyase)